MRTVILHYHLFKNAGTSLDAAFKENFSAEKGEWVTKEFPAQPTLNREEVKQWIIDSPKAKCFSSHTAILPLPKIKGVKIIPVIFYRHPIDRVASVYAFEKKQGSDSFGAKLASSTTFPGYIEKRLEIDNQCKDFHAHRLAQMFDKSLGDIATRAKMALEALPFIGLVEKYSASLEILENLLIKEGFEGVKLKPVEKNVSRGVKKSLEDKLVDIKKDLGDDLFATLIDENELDLALWDTASK